MLKFAHAENKLTGGDFIAEGFADLCNTEGNFFAGGALHVGKVDKDALCGFGAQVNLALGVFGHTLEGFKHQIKLANIGEIVRAAVRAGNILFFDIVHHLLVGPAGDIGAVKRFN